MRAYEFILETINPDVFNPEFKDTQEFDGLTYKAFCEEVDVKKYFTITVYDGDKCVAVTKFRPYRDANKNYWLEAFIVSVHSEYRGQNIANYTYAYARSMGNTIKPSHDQTDSGKAMWSAWTKSGEAKHLTNEAAVEVPSMLYHATYRPLLRSIKVNGLGGKGSERKKWEDSKPGIVYLATSPEVAESYAETSDVVSDEWLDEIVILKIRTENLDPSKFSLDRNVIDNQGDTLEYHGVIPATEITK